MQLFALKEDCCGCGACSAVCPRNCITMTADEEGFLYPFVNKEECVKCGMCMKVCASQYAKFYDTYNTLAYIGISKEPNICKNSSSGGGKLPYFRIVIGRWIPCVWSYL